MDKTLTDNERKLLEALKGLVQWFDDNFACESYLELEEDENGIERERWTPYTEMPTFQHAEKVIAEVEGNTKFPYVVGHNSCTGDRTWFTTEEAASKFIGEVLSLVDPEGVNRGDYYIDGPSDE